LGAAATEAQVWNALRTAGVDVVDVAVTEGSACRWSVIASIRKRAGGGKNALMAILALPDTKHAIVVDEGIDIHDPTEVEWARTFCVQADKDVIVIEGAQAKHVDPSVRPWELAHGQLPMTAKMGIDATIPEGIPPIYYERIRHVWLDDLKLEDYQCRPPHSPTPCPRCPAVAGGRSTSCSASSTTWSTARSSRPGARSASVACWAATPTAATSSARRADRRHRPMRRTSALTTNLKARSRIMKATSPLCTGQDSTGPDSGTRTSPGDVANGSLGSVPCRVLKKSKAYASPSDASVDVQ